MPLQDTQNEVAVCADAITRNVTWGHITFKHHYKA